LTRSTTVDIVPFWEDFWMAEATRLPDAEMDVMSRLWAAGPMTARQLREALAESRPLSHSSICTLLARLEEKGYVRRQKGDTGKAFVYRPAKPRQSASSEVLGRLVDRLFEGEPMSLVASLLESRPPSPEQLDELQRLLSQLRRAHANRQRRGPKS